LWRSWSEGVEDQEYAGMTTSWHGLQWRKLGAEFGGRNFFAVPPNSEIWGDGGGLTVSWNYMLAKW